MYRFPAGDAETVSDTNSFEIEKTGVRDSEYSVTPWSLCLFQKVRKEKKRKSQGLIFISHEKKIQIQEE